MAPLIVILGETASGKTAAGIKLALQIGGEIICADSRTIYKHLDIGTAKPMSKEQQGVPHHLLDILNPDQKFSAAQFKKLATDKIEEIWARGHFPIMVGGTGLYIDGVLFDFRFAGPDALKNPDNPRHLMKSEGGAARKLRESTFVCGLTVDRELLKQRITARVEQMFNDGFLDEMKAVSGRYGWDNESMSGNGYRVAREYFEGSASLEDVKQAFISRDTSLAKRQRTWFGRNPHIQWFEQADQLIKEAGEFSARFRV